MPNEHNGQNGHSVTTQKQGAVKAAPTHYDPLGSMDINDSGSCLLSHPEYQSFSDFIVQITHRIWEQKEIGLIYDTYHQNVVMHVGSQTLHGVPKVIAGTMSTLHAFPDRKLVAQAVICDSYSDGSKLSSHRIFSSVTNTGMSSFGEATFRKAQFRTCVDCLVKDGRIVEEWLVRDNYGLVIQLGLDPLQVARKAAAARALVEAPGRGEVIENTDGQYNPPAFEGSVNTPDGWISSLLHEAFVRKRLNVIEDYYHPSARLHYIGNQTISGVKAIQATILSLLSSVPNGGLLIDNVTVNSVADGDLQLSVRSRLQGLHDGYGILGAPTGRPLDILLLSHYRVKEEKIVEEWLTFDALDALTQVVSVEDGDPS